MHPSVSIEEMLLNDLALIGYQEAAVPPEGRPLAALSSRNFNEGVIPFILCFLLCAYNPAVF